MAFETSSKPCFPEGNTTSTDLNRLAELKAFRSRIYGKHTDWRNAFRRKRQTWNSGLPKVELVAHLLKLLLQDLSNRLDAARGKLSPIPSIANRPVFIARIEGGLGDLILAGRFLDRLCEECNTEFVVEYRSPALADFAFATCKPFLGSACVPFDVANPRCVARLRVGIVVVSDFVRADAPPEFRNVMDRAGAFCREYDVFIAASPFLDGAFGDALAEAGIRRHRACFVQCGFPYAGEDFLRPDQASIQACLSAHNLAEKTFVTISDGWDSDFGFLNGRRPTKALPAGKLEQLVRALKSNRPDVAVVQIGGSSSGMDIPGIDRNFRGRIGLRESALLLAGALLHIDTEGGLVHLARAVGTPASVFFGPTNPAFFSYENNQALLPSGDCINCYWSTNTWMAICPLKKSTICMQNHSVPAAAELILVFLAEMESCHRQSVLESHAP